jgi:hypothetical protein
MAELVERIKELELRFPRIYERIVDYLLINANRFRSYDLVRKKYRRNYDRLMYSTSIPEELPYDPDTDYRRVIEFIQTEEDSVDFMYRTSGLLDKILWAHHWIKIQNIDDILAERTTIVFKTRKCSNRNGSILLSLSITNPVVYMYQSDDNSYACPLPIKFKSSILTFDSVNILQESTKVQIARHHCNFSGTLKNLVYKVIKPVLDPGRRYRSRVRIHKDNTSNTLILIYVLE